ncbi:phage tail tube protein [Microbulbifer thermotolerans]|uniref:phage tail tube protein n=1 Tax=Microbulbifer thermotolerans TaxID=252514 RepID=UPI002670EDEE|nr:phage tail tube protein [Microbulbifer thermotolerans]WKT59106.1 phage tail tube protein [Microbulbifer thermotolerans]
MPMLAQGTQIYFIDPETGAVTVVSCATSLNPGGNPADQLETTCLEDFDRSYMPGLRTPGTATIGINPDVNNASHLRLHQISQQNPSPTLQWAVGFSDGTEPPTTTTDSDGDTIFTFPDTRSWLAFSGYISDFPFDFQLNSVVTSEISVQRSGSSILVPKVSD